MRNKCRFSTIKEKKKPPGKSHLFLWIFAIRAWNSICAVAYEIVLIGSCDYLFTGICYPLKVRKNKAARMHKTTTEPPIQPCNIKLI